MLSLLSTLWLQGEVVVDQNILAVVVLAVFCGQAILRL
jgi:hypothetical protein